MTRQDILPWGSLAISVAAAAVALTVAVNPPIDHHLDGTVSALETRVDVLTGTVSSFGTQAADQAKASAALRADMTNAIDAATAHESGDFRTLEAVINAMRKDAQVPTPAQIPDRHLWLMQQQLHAVDHDLTVLFNHAELQRVQGSGK